jgi:hypothetical protein
VRLISHSRSPPGRPTRFRTTQFSYGLSAKAHVDLTEDGLLALEARGGVSVTGRALALAVSRLNGGASASGGSSSVSSGGGGGKGGRKVGGGGAARGGGSGSAVDAARAAFAGGATATGRVELTQVILGVNVRLFFPATSAACTRIFLRSIWRSFGAHLAHSFSHDRTPSHPLCIFFSFFPKQGSTQDVKLSLGYDAGARQAYARFKENNWAVRLSLTRARARPESMMGFSRCAFADVAPFVPFPPSFQLHTDFKGRWNIQYSL